MFNWISKLKDIETSDCTGNTKGVVFVELALVLALIVVIVVGAFVTLTKEGSNIDERAMAADAVGLSLNRNPANLVELRQGVWRPADDFQSGLQDLANYVSNNASVSTGAPINTCAALFEFPVGDDGYECSGSPVIVGGIGNGGTLCDVSSCSGLQAALESKCAPDMVHPYFAGVCYPDRPQLQNIYLATRPNVRRVSASAVTVGGPTTCAAMGHIGNTAICCNNDPENLDCPDCSECSPTATDCSCPGMENYYCCTDPAGECDGAVYCYDQCSTSPPCQYLTPISCAQYSDGGAPDEYCCVAPDNCTNALCPPWAGSHCAIACF